MMKYDAAMRLFEAPLDAYDYADYDNYASEYISSDFTVKTKKSPQKINPPKIISTEPPNGKIDELRFK